MEISRDIPEKVKKLLREEVNYGCPVPDCGEPFLSWHHFDPPFAEKPHHDPLGMIALCDKHHRMADQDVFSIEQLHGFKAKPNETQFIQSKFEWLPENCIIRLGGCYAFDWCQIDVRGETILNLKLENSPKANFISFVLKDSKNQTVAKMERNWLTFDYKSVEDFVVSTSGHYIKVLTEKFKIGFECRFSRISLSDLEDMIVNDRGDPPSIPGISPEEISPKPIPDLEKLYRELESISDPLEVMAYGMNYSDMVGMGLRWHAAKHLGKDGKIPLLDFVSCRLWNNGFCLELRNGKLGGLEFCAGNTFRFN